MRHLLLFSVLLLGTFWRPHRVIRARKPAESRWPGDRERCLSSSGSSYTLTDKAGKTFQLTGDTTKLNEHVGHEIKVNRHRSPASAGVERRDGKTTAEHTLEVSSVQARLEVLRRQRLVLLTPRQFAHHLTLLLAQCGKWGFFALFNRVMDVNRVGGAVGKYPLGRFVFGE